MERKNKMFFIKYCFLLLCMLLSARLYSQTTDLSSKYDEDVCNCMNQLKDSGNLNAYTYPDCVVTAMKQDSVLFMEAAIARGIDTSDKNNLADFADTIGMQSMIRLIDKCPAYYELMDSVQYAGYENVNENAVLSKIQAMNKSDSTIWMDNTWGSRANLYFALKQYDRAIADADKGLAINPDNQLCLLIKALANEQENNFDETIALYDKLANLSGNTANLRSVLLMYEEIAKKKKADMNKNQNK